MTKQIKSKHFFSHSSTLGLHKKTSHRNISLNAYVGLAGGYEYNSSTDEWKGTFGINTPVGIAFSRGHYKEQKACFKERGSSTLFVSLVDIGAFSTYRFNDSQTEELPDVTLANIFAPGLYYVYGFPKTSDRVSKMF